MEITHINTYLSSTSLYYNLYHSLENLRVSQNVIVPLRKCSNWNWSPPVGLNLVEAISKKYQTICDRVLYKRKIRKGTKVFAEAIQEMADHGGILHAHTLFSDGGLAYEFSKQTRLPYFITVRNTDLNVFWKYMLHLRIYGRRILENASGIVFLSESYRNRLKNRVPESFWSKIGPKSQVIPNGIEGHWFGESFPRIPAEGIRLLYLGRFDKNKNLVGIIQAAKSLRSHGFPISLRMVGAKGAYADFIRSQYAHDWIEYINYTKDTTELKKHFAWASVFIMPSFTESFGLVYAEALSQGVPVIYSKGQGFDGWCPDEQCGLGVDPRNISEISSAISTLARNQNSQSCVALAQRFRWEKIAEEYRSLYGDILRRLA